MSRLVLQALRLTLPGGSLLLERSDLVLDTRITALVGANGVGKSTLCRVLAGRQTPAAGHVVAHGPVAWVDPAALRNQSVSISEWLGERVADTRLPRWLARLDLAEMDWQRPLASLSGGEITRLALAAALATGADYLILDEPAAHLDHAGRAWLADWLRHHRGGALLVSHERELLATAMRVLELSNQRLHDYALDFAAYLARRGLEQAAAERALATARTEHERVRRSAQQARERAERRAAQGRRARAGGDHGPMYFDYVQGRAEHGSGRREHAAAARSEAAAQQIRACRERLRVTASFDLRLRGQGPAAGKRVLDARDLGASAGSRRLFDGLNLRLTGPERIGIIGRNGSGKSRLLRIFAGIDPPEHGQVDRAALPMVWLDQHAALPCPSASLLANVRALQPASSEAELRERLAWFGFRGDRVAQPAATLSCGERLRLALCGHLAGTQPPQLLLLDEPDNHLDFASLAIVEHALRQYPGALIVVSHSHGFLEAIGIERVIDLDAGA